LQRARYCRSLPEISNTQQARLDRLHHPAKLCAPERVPVRCAAEALRAAMTATKFERITLPSVLGKFLKPRTQLRFPLLGEERT